MLLLRTPILSLCGEEWISWTALCPCCRRDASDDSIDLQEMIKLEPIRASTTFYTRSSVFLSYVGRMTINLHEISDEEEISDVLQTHIRESHSHGHL